MRAEHQFQIKHYAGAVTYSTLGIIEKNRDTLAQEGVDLLLSSSNPFIVLMGEIESAGPAKAAAVVAAGTNAGALLGCVYANTLDIFECTCYVRI